VLWSFAHRSIVHHEIDPFYNLSNKLCILKVLISWGFVGLFLVYKGSKDHLPLVGLSGVYLLICDNNVEGSVKWGNWQQCPDTIPTSDSPRAVQRAAT